MSANSFAPILGASLAYGLYTADIKGQLPLAGWKFVYIILGVATSITGVIFLIFVPDTPDGARWLCPRDRKLAVERVRSSQQGVINHEFRWNQVKEAFRDPFVSTPVDKGGTLLMRLDMDVCCYLYMLLYPQWWYHQVRLTTPRFNPH
jgi:MFS family permease